MKAIIACAGMGTRIAKHIEEKPKSTLKLPNGKPLILYTVETLKSLGFVKVVIIVGYKKEVVMDAVSTFGDFVQFVFNPYYSVCGTAGSFFNAKDEFDGKSGVLLLNGDSFYTKELYQKVINSTKSPILLIDKSRKDCADIKLRLDSEDCCVEYTKELEKPDAESCDLIFLSAPSTLVYKNQLTKMCEEDIENGMWEDAVVKFRANKPVYTLDVAGEFWSEIDYLEDYERIINYFKKS